MKRDSGENRERDVVTMIAQEMTVKQIGGELGISPKTVAYYWVQAKRKLGLKSYVGATKYALRIGWITL